MSWEKVRLGDIADFSNGVNFDKSAYKPGVKIISVSNFGNKLVPDYEELAEIDGSVVRENDYLQNGDIVFVRSNGNKELVGRCMLIKDTPSPVTYSGFCIRARLQDMDKYDPVFFTYHFKNKAFRQAISGSAVGANIQNLSQGKLTGYVAHIPPIEIQRRVADILSAYDDLIENNQKQIKLLEEAAQRLYKEWFIDLRFPGHETTPIIDGVPEGWKKRSLSEFADVVMGQSPKSEFYNTEGQGLPFHQGVGSYGTRFVIDSTFSSCFTRIAESGSILFSVRAPVGRLNLTKNRIVIGRGLAAINHRFGMQNYLFYLLKERFFKDDIIGNGSIFASISKDELLGQRFIVPTDNLIGRFNRIANSIDRKIAASTDQVVLLTEARDRLLPKLMNGEIEV